MSNVVRVRTRLVAILLVLIAVASAGEVPPPLPIQADPVAGFHQAIPVPGHRDHTYDLYVPKAAAAPGAGLFPLVLITGPMGRTGQWTRNEKIPQWADLAGAMVMCVNSPIFALDNDNSVIDGEPPAGIDRYLDTADRLPRVHPRLRFVLDINSSGGQSSWLVALRHPRRIAGIVLGPYLAGTEVGLPIRATPVILPGPIPLPFQHIAVYAMRLGDRVNSGMTPGGIDRLRERWRTWEAAMLPRLNANGNPFAFGDVPTYDMQSSGCHAALTWLVFASSLREGAAEPGLREGFSKQVTDAFAAVAALPTPAARETQLAFLAGLPGIERHASGAEITAAWRRAMVEAGDALPTVAERHQWWKQQASNRRLTGTAEARTVQERMQALRTAAATSREVAVIEALERLNVAVAAAGAQPTARLLDQFEAAAVQMVTESAGTTTQTMAQSTLDRIRGMRARIPQRVPRPR